MSASVRRYVPVVNGDVTTTSWYVGIPSHVWDCRHLSSHPYLGFVLADEVFRFHPVSATIQASSPPISDVVVVVIPCSLRESAGKICVLQQLLSAKS